MDAATFNSRVVSIFGETTSAAFLKGGRTEMDASGRDQDFKVEELFVAAKGHFDRQFAIIRREMVLRGFVAMDTDSATGAFQYCFTNGSCASALVERWGHRIYFRARMPLQSNSSLASVAVLTGGPAHHFTMPVARGAAAKGEVVYESPPSIPAMEQAINAQILLFLSNLLSYIRLSG